jgi:hypothetical protein
MDGVLGGHQDWESIQKRTLRLLLTLTLGLSMVLLATGGVKLNKQG